MHNKSILNDNVKKEVDEDKDKDNLEDGIMETKPAFSFTSAPLAIMCSILSSDTTIDIAIYPTKIVHRK
jgi:hypothetical protein